MRKKRVLLEKQTDEALQELIKSRFETELLEAQLKAAQERVKSFEQAIEVFVQSVN